ncbi:MAG: hypothetical protein JXX28_19090 [Deltaproteobacteria bacterium]|nr:hypothetical protein [Deltaproteobacteria bacterium]
MRTLALAVALLAGGEALAVTPAEQAQIAQLDRLRAQVADQVHLAAFDLVDELVYGWTADPVFPSETQVVLAGVTVPVGLGTGLQALIENHLAAVLAENPSTHVQLVHCPQCTAVVVHSGPEGTVISRGIDDPEVLERIGGGGGKHALFVDVEAEGAWLVLRARLTRLTPDLPIVWSHTLSTAAGTPALLRQPTHLKSAAEARREYLDALSGRGNSLIPLRFAVRSYAAPPSWYDPPGTPPPPFLWLQSGVELAPTSARAWTASLLAGVSYIPQAYQGLMTQARISRLITGRARSLTRPDLYVFGGIAMMTVWGPGTASFQAPTPNGDDLLTVASPREILGTFHLGADLRLGNRIGISAFLETLPALSQSENLGEYYYGLGISFQSLGSEVTFWF